MDPNDQNGPDLETKIEEMRLCIRKAETAKTKAEARIEVLREGGVNVDEWLQEAESLNVQDIQRSASSLSVSTHLRFNETRTSKCTPCRTTRVRTRSTTATSPTVRQRRRPKSTNNRTRTARAANRINSKMQQRSTVSGVGNELVLTHCVWHGIVAHSYRLMSAAVDLVDF